MADLRNNFVGIKSPNPFWLASAPPTDKAYNVERAFKAGWGGVVWKTLGEEGPPVVNVNGPRYGAIWGADRRLLTEGLRFNGFRPGTDVFFRPGTGNAANTIHDLRLFDPMSPAMTGRSRPRGGTTPVSASARCRSARR